MDRRTLSFALVLAAMALLVGGLLVAFASPAPDCSGQDNRLVCEKEAYEQRTVLVLLMWVAGLVVTAIAIPVYMLDAKRRQQARRQARKQVLAAQAAGERDARKVAVRDELGRT